MKKKTKKEREPVVAVAGNVVWWLLRRCYAGYLLYKEKIYKGGKLFTQWKALLMSRNRRTVYLSVLSWHADGQTE